MTRSDVSALSKGVVEYTHFSIQAAVYFDQRSFNLIRKLRQNLHPHLEQGEIQRADAAVQAMQ